jgi:phage terminase large subunit GpA-like protein
VYSFVAGHSDVCVAARGQTQQSVPVRLYGIDVDFEGKRKARGIQMLSIDDGFFKAWVYSRVARGRDVADSWTMAGDIGASYAEQLLSEELISLPSGKTKWVQRRKDNHALDCEKLNGALAHWLNFRMLREPEKSVGPRPRGVSQPKEFKES